MLIVYTKKICAKERSLGAQMEALSPFGLRGSEYLYHKMHESFLRIL